MTAGALPHPNPAGGLQLPRAAWIWGRGEAGPKGVLGMEGEGRGGRGKGAQEWEWSRPD